jgi:CRP/FNR family transcriptional regulator, cyclic AMP receptor protein
MSGTVAVPAMRTEAIEALRRLTLFRGLSIASLSTIAERSVFRSMRRDTIIFRRGEPCRGLHIVIRGQIRVFRASPDGREQTLHTQGPGQPLAEVPLFDGGPYPASACSLAESRLLFLPLDDFQWLYRNHPEIADATIKELGRRLRRLVGLVEKISLRDVPARVAMTLLEHAERHGAMYDGVSFELGQTHEQLAAELATTRESVSRAMSRLQKDGLIVRTGTRYSIVSVSGLEGIATSR